MIYSLDILVLSFLCAVHYSTSTSHDDQQKYEQIKFDILPAHVLSVNTSDVTQNTIKVRNKKDCVFSCINVAWCRSVNVKRTPESDGLYVCEMISTDKYTNQKDLRQDANFTHYSMKNPCEAKPCPSYKKCKVQGNRPGYTCKCPTGFTGETCQECIGEALGMENGAIPHSAITASSCYNQAWDILRHARLNSPGFLHWASGFSKAGEWLQVDFGKLTVLTKVATQGRQYNPNQPSCYTASYSLIYRRESENWQSYVHTSLGETLPGNTGDYGTVTHTLNPNITTRYIRINPKTWVCAIVLRVEFYGCFVS